MNNHRRSSGYSLTEVLYASAIGAVLLGSSSSLYLLISKRTNDDAGLNLAVAQATQLADELQDTIKNSLTCTVTQSGNRQVMFCQLPANGTDGNSDGIMDQFPPANIDFDGALKFNPGQSVGYYWSDQSGDLAPTNQGPELGLWRSFSPASGGATVPDPSWSRIGDQTRWTLIDSVQFVANYGTRSTTVTITARVLGRNMNRAVSTDPADQRREYTLVRTIPWGYAN